MKKLILISLIVLFSSCHVFQVVETNKMIKGNCTLFLINWKHENIIVKVDGKIIPIKPSRRFKLVLPEGEHTILFNGKTSTFEGKHLVTYKKILK